MFGSLVLDPTRGQREICYIECDRLPPPHFTYYHYSFQQKRVLDIAIINISSFPSMIALDTEYA